MIRIRRLLLLIVLWAAASGCSLRFEERIPAFEDYHKAAGTDYLEFLAVGDTGYGSVGQYRVGGAMKEYALANPVTFVLLLGDNFYSEGVSSTADPQWGAKFENVYDPTVLSMPFFPVLGNHDYLGDITAQLDYLSPNADRWQMPARYYKVSKQLPDSTVIDLFLIDAVAFAEEPEQRAWLDTELGASTARWKIVAGHYPVYSNGRHGDNPLMISLLKPILDGRADAYLCGHDHDLQILAGENGVSYLVDGAGGAVRGSGVADNTIFAASRPGFMAFLVSRDELVCRVLDAWGGLLFSVILKSK